MSDIEILDLTPENIAEYGVCRYKDAKKHVELRRKIDWFKEYYPKGLRGSVESQCNIKRFLSINVSVEVGGKEPNACNN
jgi:hypothetical protein